MRLLLSAGVALFTLNLSAETIDPDRFGGPTELQDTFLLSQVRYQTYPENARVLMEKKWRVTAEVDWTAHLARTERYLFDGESVTSTLKVRHSPLEHWEFGLDIPMTTRLDGTADEFIEFVETTLNARVPDRYELPRDQYQAVLGTRTDKVLRLRKESGLNDVTLRAKRSLLRSEKHWLDAAAAATMSLPTGNSTFGGRGVAPSLGLHLQKPVKQWLNLYAGAATIYYSDNDEQGLEFADFRTMSYAGAMWKPINWFGLIGMYQMYTPFARTHQPLDSEAHYYSVTGRFWINEWLTFETGVVENLGLIENRNSSDVTFKFALSATF